MTSDTDQLAGLLTAGERAAFYGAPLTGVAPLRRAVEVAGAAGRAAEASAAAWLLGVCLGAAGHYGDAFSVLDLFSVEPQEDERTAEEEVFRSLALSTRASLYRQLGRHVTARELDKLALVGSGDATAVPGEARFDALLGLAADAVGLEEPGSARKNLARAHDLVHLRPDWWRQRVRVHWVRAEVALLTGEPDEAVAESAAALTMAEASGAPRHVAKSSLFLGVSLVQAGRLDEAGATLRRAALLAESLGALPLLWHSRAVLGALLQEASPEESQWALASARRTVETIAATLDPVLRKAWLARPDVAALLAV